MFPSLATSTATSPIPLVGESGATYPAGTAYKTIFPSGHIPAADINPISQKLLSYVPLPNFGSNLFTFNPITTRVQDQGIMRVDHTMAHDAIWFTGFWENTPTTDTLPFTGSTLPGFGDTNQRFYTMMTASWTHTISPTTINEVRASFLRFNYQAVIPQTPVLPSTLGFNITPQNTAAAGIPYVSVTGLFALGFSTNGPQPRIDSTYELTDNFSKVWGSHTLKFGYDGKRYQVNNPFFGRNNGSSPLVERGQTVPATPARISCLAFPIVTDKAAAATSMPAPTNIICTLKIAGRFARISPSTTVPAIRSTRHS